MATSTIKDSLSSVKKHDMQTSVDLSSYTSTWYTCPSDGYVTASCGSQSNAIAVARIAGTTISTTFSIGGFGNGSYGSWSCFVRAGMKVQTARVENNGTVLFRPLM